MMDSDQIPEYVSISEIACWLGRTGVWVRCVRQGIYGPLPSPFPSPDARYRSSKNRVVPLWLPERRPDFERWHQEYLELPHKHRPGQRRERASKARDFQDEQEERPT